LLLLSLGPSLLQFASIVSLLLNHGNPIFKPVCVFTVSSSAFAFLIDEMDFIFESLFAAAIPLLLSFYYGFFAVSEILNHSDICAVSSLCNAVGLLILHKLCPAFTFLQQLMTKRL